MNQNPRIVAIETSGRHGSVAVACGATLLAIRELPATQRHAIELMPAIRDLVQAQCWSPEQIQHVYLSLGPGSFTGLRIAVAVARGLAQALACKLVGVPSLDVMACNAPPEFAMVVPVLDAKRGQVFAAQYQRPPAASSRSSSPGDSSWQRIAAPALVDPAAFMEHSLELAQGAPIAILGEGVDYHRAALLSAGPNIVELDRSFWPGRAAIVHQLGFAAAQSNQFSDPQSLLPIYIRLPEAEEVYRKKHGLKP